MVSSFCCSKSYFTRKLQVLVLSFLVTLFKKTGRGVLQQVLEISGV